MASIAVLNFTKKVMNNMMNRLLTIIGLLALMISCGDSDDSSVGGSSGLCNDSFDRGALLSNLADSIIVPSYENYVSTLDDISVATESFINSPSIITLEELREDFVTAYMAWQFVGQYEIGRAEEIRLQELTNDFPADTSMLQNSLAAGQGNLSIAVVVGEQGFPALDYILYGFADSEVALVDSFTNSSLATQYGSFLTQVVDKLASDATDVLNDWNNGFRDEFVTTINGSVAGSVSRTVNDFIFYYESEIRSNKVANPAGVFSRAGETLPSFAEGFYSQDNSKQLLLASLDAVIRFYRGESFDQGTDGIGLDDYLNSLTGCDGANLDAEIQTSLQEAIDFIDTNFDDNIAEMVSTEEGRNIALAGFNELQDVVISVKTDLLQFLNVSADFQDADGD